uniref:CSC1-like protein n=1 Tax=Ananas comosus var. bracteatus TaxID=296719 RepID=A0A6V7QNG8_ANACO|nr:unnamed protein product [Ananas comosus var. bracteatus]
MEDDLRITRFRDGNGNPSDPNSNSISIFTMMIQGIPKTLAADKAPLEEYIQHRYPGKVYRVIVPFDLCSLEHFVAEWTKVKNKISWLEARMNARSLFGDDDDEDGVNSNQQSNQNMIFTRIKELWAMAAVKLGFTDEERLRKLHNRMLILESKLMDYKEGRAPGAGIAFVVFKDVYTANKAVRDFRSERKKRPIGQFFPLMELQLERSRWRVERAPPASDIYWNHLGLNKVSLQLRRVAVNTCLVLMLLFCSSPLAIISGMQSAGRIINAEAMDHAQSWLAWLESSSWFWTVILQFLPNVLIFVSMYIIIPSALSYLSKFECHLTVSGEQRAALLKMFGLNDIEGHSLSVYPINRSFHMPKQKFDFAQYYAFNLTIFALTMIYSLFAPLVVPVGAIYFGYRYVVDKYNFLFVYRVRGFPAGNDGKLMDRVLCIMHFCIILFLLSMLLFFSVQGDSMKLQAIFTLGLLVFYKVLPSRSDGFQPSLLEGMQSVDSFVDGPTDYEARANALQEVSIKVSCAFAPHCVGIALSCKSFLLVASSGESLRQSDIMSPSNSLLNLFDIHAMMSSKQPERNSNYLISVTF